MVKENSFDWKNPWNLHKHKHKHIFVKFFISILLMGLAFRLLFSQSANFSPVSETPFVEKPSDGNTHLLDEALRLDDQATQNGKCDLFTGEWIPNPLGPIYTNESCHVVEEQQNCMKNGRPDSGYLYWRWKPHGCELPLFDSERFLEAMRNKSFAFIGDSISRNHVQSLLCILSKVEEGVEVYHDKEYKSRRWIFPSYNFTLSVLWSPFLVKAVISEDINGVSTSEVQVYLDKLDEKWADQFHSIDYSIISGGKWFLKSSMYWENNKIIGCHYCPGKNVTETGYEHSYRRALRLMLNYVATSNHKGLTFFRPSTPDHFENGEWFSGGTCKRSVPYKEGEISLDSVDEMLRKIELEEFKKAVAIALEKGVNLKLLDTKHLSLLRPDGHPGPYRQFHPFAEDKNERVQNDCLHWCLPGPIDNWNDLVMEMVFNG
ncbi:hypothetical protein MRB53_030135 [Persea americana]|uniref:Uncharacterized protein n=1 Tax=Persea americana TaxID=3435 RepID=A0ACC2KKR1_PERAE|nr:hypothetical protein MRB53_030135 [Persea americana]